MRDPIFWFQAGLVLSALSAKPLRVIVVAKLGWAYARPRIESVLAAGWQFALRSECPAHHFTLVALAGAYGAWQSYGTVRDAFDGFWLSWLLAFVIWSLFRRREPVKPVKREPNGRPASGARK